MIRNGSRFCNSQCATGYREDRAAGLIYGTVYAADTCDLDNQYDRKYWTWDEWSLHNESCAYCGAPVSSKPRPITPRSSNQRWATARATS